MDRRRGLIGIEDLTTKDWELILALSEGFEECEKTPAGRQMIKEVLFGYRVDVTFFEPSTRTFLSTMRAADMLGASVNGTQNASTFSSAVKNESWRDQVIVSGGFCDLLVARHPDNNAARKAAEVSPVPYINAGSGSQGGHPTQTITDVLTIVRRLGRKDNLRIAFVGDVRYSRTIHSLLDALISPELRGIAQAKEIYLVAPRILQLDQARIKRLRFAGVIVHVAYELTNEIMRGVDVVYMTRLQRERHGRFSFTRARLMFGMRKFWLTPELVAEMDPRAIVMHPLPRLAHEELPESIDADHRAVYFAQSKQGLFARMALLTIILRGTSSKALDSVRDIFQRHKEEQARADSLRAA